MSNTTEDTLRQLAEKIAHADGSTFSVSKLDEEKAPIKRRALGLLDQRARSRHELKERLSRNEEFAPKLIDQVLDELTDAKLLNDASFAQEWVRQRSVQRGKSRAFLNRELQQKGVGEEVRREALAQVSDDDEAVVAKKLAEKKACTIKHLPADYAQRQKDLRKIVGVLARRGFDQSLAMDIARTALSNRYDEIDLTNDDFGYD